MGLSGSHLHCEHTKDLSPWTTEIFVVNQMQTPALILEARHHAEPTPEGAIQHTIPPGEHAIMSGYVHKEPRATLYMRTGLHSAKVLRVPNAGRIVVSCEPHGLHVESQDGSVTIEELTDVDPATIPGLDSVPMILRNEHFKDVAPPPAADQSPIASAAGGA
eukprot:gb/GFBE01063448.1/.p1 GENE.gb/GFBE01063448.1/~~gb/GFBE01063448.1/.p1  ORF type:complete len:162 (+),score=23.04 gb/GFBE01063448.1/:1-486(+)